MDKNKIKLVPLDMNLSNEHKHPQIKTDGTQYLVKVKGQYFAGCFDEVWFGLNFSGWYAPLQFDAPGTNKSKWEQIWEIVEDS